MEPWYKVATPRAEVREGRSFNPDEFAIALEQVVAGTAPLDYRDAEKFFNRTYFTRALREHAGMVLRRLSGKTENTASVLTLVTQFGGGKTHTLTALYHLVKNSKAALRNEGVANLLLAENLAAIPQAKIAVFVGNAWDPKPGRDTPWMDIAFQLAGAQGVEALGKKAMTSPPGTDSLGELFKLAGGKVLILFDEVLNFMNRHRDLAESFHSFIQNLTVAMTGTTSCATVISLPRSQVEMTPADMEWQERITKVVRRVAKDLIANDETEISEVVRRRLFEDLGKESVRRSASKEYADWCFERRAQLPPEWTSVDSAATETKAKEFLRKRFEACYPFHPATLSVFQRKWQALPQYQQTRGTLAMLAQWVSWVFRQHFQGARNEPLITLGSAPLDIPDFQAVVIGQLGESRLVPAIEADIAGHLSHANALDGDAKRALKEIHRRVGTAIFFESSGGMKDKVAHLPELRFALGEPSIDTTSIDNAAFALESRAFFLHRSGTEGFKFGYKPTLKKVVSDRRASLDEDDVKKVLREMVRKEFERGATVPLVPYPSEAIDIQDSPRLTFIIVDPEAGWIDQTEEKQTGDSKDLRARIADWCKNRGASPRLYPASLIWCVRKGGRALREKVEQYLAWKNVKGDIDSGALTGEIEQAERQQVAANIKEAEEAVRDEIWAGYQFVFLLDNSSKDGIRVIPLGAGHASAGETLTGRVIAALRTETLLNESVGSGYIERNWPPALKESGAWPLAGLRQSFLDGSLTRLIDSDKVLRSKIPEFIQRGDFGLASGIEKDGSYTKVWYKEFISPDDITFEKNVFLLLKSKAESRISAPSASAAPTEVKLEEAVSPAVVSSVDNTQSPIEAASARLEITGGLPFEIWNRFGSKILPKIKSAEDFSIGISITLSGSAKDLSRLNQEISQALADLGLSEQVKITSFKE